MLISPQIKKKSFSISLPPPQEIKSANCRAYTRGKDTLDYFFILLSIVQIIEIM